MHSRTSHRVASMTPPVLLDARTQHETSDGLLLIYRVPSSVDKSQCAISQPITMKTSDSPSLSIDSNKNEAIHMASSAVTGESLPAGDFTSLVPSPKATTEVIAEKKRMLPTVSQSLIALLSKCCTDSLFTRGLTHTCDFCSCCRP